MSNYAQVVDALGDATALTMFESIANGQGKHLFIISSLKLTKKQYYTRIGKLHNAGLISRANGTFVTTLFGKIVYNWLKMVEEACASEWKIKALDTIRSDGNTTADQTRQVIELLVTHNGVKQVLLTEVDK